MPRSRSSSAAPRGRVAAAAGGAANVAAILRRTPSASPVPCRKVRDTCSSRQTSGDGHSDLCLGNREPSSSLCIAGRPASAGPRGRPPLLTNALPAPSCSLEPAVGDHSAIRKPAADIALWNPAEAVVPASTPRDVGSIIPRSQSPQMLLRGTDGRNMQRVASLDLGRSSRTAPRQDSSRNAEMGLLRARFDLRLDVERVRTQDAASELKDACDEAVGANQKSAARQLASMRQGYDEIIALQRSTEQSALNVARAEARDEASAARSEVGSMRSDVSELRCELAAAREHAEREAASATAARAKAASEVAAASASREEDAAEAFMQFQQRREVQVSEVVARFEHEHFQMTVQVASEADKRRCFEQQEVALQLEFEEVEMRCSNLSEACQQQQLVVLPLEPSVALVPASTQTEIEDIAGVSLLSRQQELSALRLADVETRLWSNAAMETERLARIQQRMCCTLQLKDDVIKALKDEQLRRERENCDARGILAKVHACGQSDLNLMDGALDQ